MWSPLRKIGNNAESIAKDFLIKNNLKLIKKNYLTTMGEIDLIMLEKDILVFIEVRYRESVNFTSTIESVDCKKQQKIIKTAQIFLAKNPQFDDNICRFDVVGVENSLKSPNINWIKDAFIL